MKKNIILFGPITLLIIFTMLYGFISIAKHNHFQSFAWDLAFFDQLIWKVSVGLEPRSSFGNLHLLGDHFQPILYFLAPLYWIRSDVRILLLVQAGIAVFGAYPLYLLSMKVLKDDFLALSIMLSYLMFTGFQFAVLDGFHQSVFSTLFITLVFYFLETGNRLGYWGGILGLLFTKEEYALLVVAIGFVAFIYYKKRWLGIGSIILGFIAFFSLIYLVIPFFQGGSYAHFGYGKVGNTPVDVLMTGVTKPWIIIHNLFLPIVKIKTVISTLLSFGFFPLLSPIHLIPVTQQFIVRFLDSTTIHRWQNTNHYSFPLASLMAVGTIYGCKRLLNSNTVAKRKYILALSIVSFSLMQDIIFHGPVNSLLKPSFYRTQPWEYDARELVRHVPDTVSVASTNAILPHLSQRKQFYLLPVVGSAEYIAVDLHDGPNKFSPATKDDIEKLMTKVINKKQYHIIWQENESILLKRSTDDSDTSR